MKELKPRITENGIEYVLVGDYYIPDLKLPEENRPIGKYGQMHREYLKKQCYGRYSSLLLFQILPMHLSVLTDRSVFLRQLQIRDVIVPDKHIFDAILCNSWFQFLHGSFLLDFV